MPDPLLTKTWRFLRRGQIVRAAQNFRIAWATHEMADEFGPRTTCPEAIALADLLCALGEPEFAGLMLTAHAVEDAEVPDRLACHRGDARIDQVQVEDKLAYWHQRTHLDQPDVAGRELDTAAHTASWDGTVDLDQTA